MHSQQAPNNRCRASDSGPLHLAKAGVVQLTHRFNIPRSPLLYSKHKILEIPDLFQLSVAKFM